VPRRAPELVSTEARRLYRGAPEKVATTSLPGVIVDRVSITSRWGSADELEAMSAMVMALPATLRAQVTDLWCNSKATSYVVTVRSRNLSKVVTDALDVAAHLVCGGHNGIEAVVEGRPPPATALTLWTPDKLGRNGHT
jgi:hypothetical protein